MPSPPFVLFLWKDLQIRSFPTKIVVFELSTALSSRLKEVKSQLKVAGSLLKVKYGTKFTT